MRVTENAAPEEARTARPAPPRPPADTASAHEQVGLVRADRDEGKMALQGITGTLDRLDQVASWCSAIRCATTSASVSEMQATPCEKSVRRSWA